MTRGHALDEPRRWLVMPVETKARELDAKALLAFIAAERGWGTILATSRTASAPDLPRGVFLGHTISHGEARLLRTQRARGATPAAWCEEGLVYRDAADYGRRKVETDAYDQLDVFFAWGPNQARDMVDALGCDGRKLVIAGNPRFDVLRPEWRPALGERVSALREAYGRFILVNSNLNKYNHYFGPEFYVRRAIGTMTGDPRSAEQWARGMVAFQATMMRALVAAVGALSRMCPDHTIVIRPHPSEDHARWQTEMTGVPAARVVYEGNMAAWILAADATVHNNCTTGVEAYLLGKPAIAFRPVRDPRFDLPLPHALSVEADSVDSLCALVARRLAGERLVDVDDAARSAVAFDHIAGLSDTPACETIMNTLDRLDVAAESVRPGPPAKGGAVANELPPTAQRWDEARAARYASYVRQKCDALGAREVSAWLASARRVAGRFEHVQVADLRDDLVCVY